MQKIKERELRSTENAILKKQLKNTENAKLKKEIVKKIQGPYLQPLVFFLTYKRDQ